MDLLGDGTGRDTLLRWKQVVTCSICLLIPLLRRSSRSCCSEHANSGFTGVFEGEGSGERRNRCPAEI